MKVNQEACKYGGITKKNGNCTNADPDGFPVQCVGPWAERKYDHLQRYIEATRAVRAKFERGGSCFVDLFSGPGRVRVRGREATQDGSPLIALKHSGAPFSKLLFCELDNENVEALRERTQADSRVTIFPGDSNELIDEVARAVPPHGLNIAFVDPYAPSQFKWATIERLARLQRMDLLLHFPWFSLKRNVGSISPETIDAMVGTDSWRKNVRKAGEIRLLIEILKDRLVQCGYQRDVVNSVPIKNTSGGLLYYLVFASKDSRGTTIWNSLTKNDGAQRTFDLE